MQQSHICEESDTFIIRSWILRFSQIYMHFAWSQPHAHNINVSPKFERHLSSPDYKDLSNFTFCSAFLRFLIQDNGVANGLV